MSDAPAPAAAAADKSDKFGGLQKKKVTSFAQKRLAGGKTRFDSADFELNKQKLPSGARPSGLGGGNKPPIPDEVKEAEAAAAAQAEDS